jgi:aspartyl-tRNA(Asn)/glutamyl-tRNA(Gln) amidotransferase subunit B
VAQFKEGKQQVLGFLVGQVMKASGGKANPGKVNELLKKKLAKEN